MSEERAECRHVNTLALLCCGLMEPVFRMAGWAGALLGKDRDGVEMVLRGRVLGGSSKWKIGRNVRFIGPAERFSMGEGVCLYGNAYLNANGENGLVQIGPRSHVDQFCVLYGQGGLHIGQDCAVASGVIVYSQTNADGRGDGTPVSLQPTRYDRVTIGDGCWLGAGVTVTPGVTIGDGAQVGAGAVVLSNLPGFSVSAGVPAKVIRLLRV